MRNFGRCGFCEQSAVTLCEWPTEKFFTVHYYELRVGDSVKRSIEVAAHRKPATVLQIEEASAPGFIQAKHIVLQIGNRQKEILVRGHSLLRRAKLCPCGMPVCENHLRCVEEGVEYCMDHWHAWEAVA